VNALLKYGYAVLEGQVCIIAEAGLDPTIGFLHACRPGRQAVVYALAEDLSPVVASVLPGRVWPLNLLAVLSYNPGQI
jgi:CRISPR-associated protein Cas1